MPLSARATKFVARVFRFVRVEVNKLPTVRCILLLQQQQQQISIKRNQLRKK